MLLINRDLPLYIYKWFKKYKKPEEQEGSSMEFLNTYGQKFSKFEVYGNTRGNDNVTGNNKIIVQNKNLIPNSSNIDLTTNANITLLDFGKDITFDSITLSFYMKNAKYTTNGNIACLQKNDNSTNYQSTTSFGMTAETVLNGKYSKTLTNITFRYLILYARTTSYVSWQQGTCNIQLESGTTATDYIAHAEQSVIFPLGNTVMTNLDYLTDEGIYYGETETILTYTEEQAEAWEQIKQLHTYLDYTNITQENDGLSFILKVKVN